MKLGKIQLPHPQSSQSGFTIIESLVALIVVALLLAAVSPVIVLATATRLQARRVELATQAARAYIDGVKAGTIPDNTVIDVPLTAANSTSNRTIANQIDQYLLGSVNPPTGTSGLNCFTASGNISTSCDSSSPNTTPLFYIQAVRGAVTVAGVASDPDKGQSYRLGVRVYRKDAFPGAVASNNGTKTTQKTFTGGLGNRYAPLVEMTTDIVRSEPSYSGYCQRLGGCQ